MTDPNRDRPASAATAEHGWEFLSEHPVALAGPLVLLIFLAYLPVFQNGFVWDDDQYITECQPVQAPDGMVRIWASAETPQYYPLVFTTFFIEHAIWKLNPLGYHLVNVLLHAANAVLLLFLLKRLGFSTPVAWMTAAVFGVHPVTVESVAWATERKNVLSLFFALWALVQYVEHLETRRVKPYLIALLLFACALLSKTAVVTVPFTMLLIVYLKYGSLDVRALAKTVPFFALSAGMAVVTIVWERYHVGAVGSEWEFSTLERLLLAAHAVLFYAYKLLIPIKMTFLYPRWEIDAGSMQAYWPLAVLIGIAVVIWALRKYWPKGTSFGLGHFLVSLLPVLGFVNFYWMRYSFVGDHLQYLAMWGFVLVVVLVVSRLIGDKGIAVTAGPLVRIGCLLIVLLLAVQTFRHCKAFESSETLWKDTLLKNEKAWFAYNNLGVYYQKEGRPAEAEQYYFSALNLAEDNAEPNRNLGLLAIANGEFERAERYLKRAIELVPSHFRAYNDLGTVARADGRLSEAVSYLEHALMLEPRYAEARYNLARTLQEAGQLPEALEQSKECVRLVPTDPRFHHDYGMALLKADRKESAIEHLQECVRLRPKNGEAHNDLTVALLAVGRIDEAITHATHAANLQPDLFEAHLNLGIALAKDDRFEMAADALRRAIEIQPDNVKAHFNLIVSLSQLGRHEDALASCHEIVRLRPELPDAYDLLGRTLIHLKRYDEAAEALNSALSLAPTSPEAIFHLGELYRQTGRAGAAVDCYRRVVLLKPDHGRAYFGLACLLADAGQIEAAFMQLENALKNAGTTRREMTTEPALARLRDDPRFEALLSRIIPAAE